MKRLEIGMYGLSKLEINSVGYQIISKCSALEVLRTAWSGGIRYVDTAPGYGNGVADELIKEVRSEQLNFKVCSKIGLDVQRNQFKHSVQDVYYDVDRIADSHGGFVSRVLIHSPPPDFLRDRSTCLEIIKYIRNVLGEGVSVGIALRSPNDLLYCKWGRSEQSFVFQSNFSWLDTRIRNIALDMGVSIIARSIYGSGILVGLYNSIRRYDSAITFIPEDIRHSWDIQSILERAHSEVMEFGQVCKINQHASLDDLVARQILIEDFISGAILGPTSVEELKSTLTAFCRASGHDKG